MAQHLASSPVVSCSQSFMLPSGPQHLFVPPLTSLEMVSYHLSSPSQPRHMHSTTGIEDSSGKGVCIRAVVVQGTNEPC
jgi:hypothetical protein